MAWLLLVLTAACAALAVDALRAGASRQDSSIHFWPREWKKGLDHVPLAEQERTYRALRYPLLGAGAMAWVFLAMTGVLAVLTVKAFLA